MAKTFEACLGLVIRGLIRLYRLSFSYFLGQHCRFLPTCSVYADEAIRRHGPFLGSQLAFKRVCRCHPWHKMKAGEGFDPVPARVNKRPTF